VRDVAEDDLPIFFDHQLEPDAIQMAAFLARDRAAFMAHWAKILGDETIIKKTILADGHVAGNIVCFGQSGEREVGYWLGKQYWGQGVATRALAAFLTHVTARPLYAHVAKHNIASRRVLEKCGFAMCGEDIGTANAPGAGVEEFILILAK
jgi:RimJ/RimL family protein N-acetyltransferase